jgi:hypothetical protein
MRDADGLDWKRGTTSGFTVMIAVGLIILVYPISIWASPPAVILAMWGSFIVGLCGFFFVDHFLQGPNPD